MPNATKRAPVTVESIAHELFMMLRTIGDLVDELGYAPTLSEIGRSYGCSRQWAHEAVGKLRAVGLLKAAPYARSRGVELSNGGKLLLKTTSVSGFKH